jgi:uncharacterized protein (TIGR02246 family)
MSDEEQIRALHRQILEGWNRGDGAAFAAPFREGAWFIGFDGSLFRGRQAIAEGHQALFDRWLRGSRLVAERTDVTFVSSDVAVVHATGGTIMRGKSRPAPERDSVQTLVAVRDGGKWSFASFQNTRIRPIGANVAAAVLWLLPDKLWALLFRLTRTVPRTEMSWQEGTT